MNLEKNMWSEDPTKSWMRQYQCENWRSYLKDQVMPAIEQKRKTIMSYVSLLNTSSALPFLPIPMYSIIENDAMIFPQVSLCVVRKTEVRFLRDKRDEYFVPHMIDSDLGSLGMNDVFFSFQAYGLTGRLWQVYFSPTHLEEVCCLFEMQRVPFQLAGQLVFKDIIFINGTMWERLGNSNPFMRG